MLFINTRPAERAHALTECLQKADFKVLDLPLLVLEALPLTSDLQLLYTQLLETQMIVVVSPTAVHIGMQYLQQSGVLLSQLNHIQWIAVGQSTAQALAEYTVSSLVPEVETSEGMLSLPILNNALHLKKIAFWRGEGGRQFMMQECLNRNIGVLNFLLYTRSCPISTQQKMQQLETQVFDEELPYWMCISSEASWRNWLQLTQNNQQLLQNCHYLVLGERLYQLLQHDKNQAQYCFSMSLISTLDPNSILQTITALHRKL